MRPHERGEMRNLRSDLLHPLPMELQNSMKSVTQRKSEGNRFHNPTEARNQSVVALFNGPTKRNVPRRNRIKLMF